MKPFLQKGHPTQSGRPSASFSDAEIDDLLNFLFQRIYDTLRGSPAFVPQDILTGDAAAGEAFFKGQGACGECHQSTSDLTAVVAKISDPVDLQQRWLMPMNSRGGGPGKSTAITVTITPPTGHAVSGVLQNLDDFFATYRDAAGGIRTIPLTRGTKVVVTNPLQPHRDLLERLTDKQMHDVTAYLWSLR